MREKKRERMRERERERCCVGREGLKQTTQ